MQSVIPYSLKSEVKYVKTINTSILPLFESVESDGVCSFYSYLKSQWCNLYCNIPDNKELYSVVYSDERQKWLSFFSSERKVIKTDYYRLLNYKHHVQRCSSIGDVKESDALFADEELAIYHISTYESLTKHGKNTWWCTCTSRVVGEHMLSLGDYYIIHTHEDIRTGFNKISIIKKFDGDYVIVNSFGDPLNIDYVHVDSLRQDVWFDINLYIKIVCKCINILSLKGR